MRPAPRLFMAIALVASAVSGPSALTQPAPAPVQSRSFVQIVRLRPDMVTEWIALQRNEVIPAQKKAGVTSRTTLVTQVGNAFEYAILTPFPSWAAMDGDAPLVRALGAEGAAQLNAKLRKCVLTQQSYMSTRVDSLTIAAAPADALVWRIAVRRIVPGKRQEYLAYYKNDVLPGLQKAKEAGALAGATVAFRGAGATSGEFTTVTQYSKFADLDKGDPLVQALGAAEAERINAKSVQFATSTQVIIRRRIADLSF